MYYFDILQILQENKEPLSTEDIYFKIKLINPSAVYDRMNKVLLKMYLKNVHIERDRRINKFGNVTKTQYFYWFED